MNAFLRVLSNIFLGLSNWMRGRRESIEKAKSDFVVDTRTKRFFRYQWLFYFLVFFFPAVSVALALFIVIFKLTGVQTVFGSFVVATFDFGSIRLWEVVDAFGQYSTGDGQFLEYTSRFRFNLWAWAFWIDVVSSTIAFLYPQKIGLEVLRYGNQIVDSTKERKLQAESPRKQPARVNKANERALAMIGESSIEVQESGAFLYFSNLVIEFFFAFFIRTTIWAIIFFVPIMSIVLFLTALAWWIGVISFDDSGSLLGIILSFGFIGFGLLLNTVLSTVMGFLTCVQSFFAMTGISKEGANFHFRLGARIPSNRERDKVIDVVQQIVNIRKETICHDEFLVIDSPIANSFTSGRTLYLTSEAINSTWLNALIAHECGHLANGDGRLLKALRDFVYGFAQAPMINQRSLSRGTFEKKIESVQEVADLPMVVSLRVKLWFWALILGGIAPIMFARRWTVYFRQRDYLADDFAYQLGFGQDLLDYLQSGSAGVVAIAPGSQTWTQFTELRIDRLLLRFEKEHFVEAEELAFEAEENISEEQVDV